MKKYIVNIYYNIFKIRNLMIKIDKIIRILSLYNRLELGEEINKTSFSLDYNINEWKIVDRDIEDIRLFY